MTVRVREILFSAGADLPIGERGATAVGAWDSTISRGDAEVAETRRLRTAVQSAARRRNPQGFTLMEIMIALTVTALVATLAAAALHAGMDVRERVQEHRMTVDAEARATSWLGVMLRHPPAASAVDEAMFTISQETTLSTPWRALSLARSSSGRASHSGCHSQTPIGP